MIKHLSFILLLTICVSGCVKNDLEEKTLQPVSGRVFTASFESENARTYVEEGNLLRWNAGDQISLFDSNTLNRQYQFDGETGDNAGTFSIVNAPFGTGNDLNCHYALYPYASNVKITENGVITATLPAVQSYAENSFGLDANTMVAVTKDVDDTFLKFRNVGGYLKLQLYGDNVTVKSITLTGNNNEKLAGKATITPAYGQSPTLAMSDDATTSITLDCGEGVKIGTTEETATAFWIVVPPIIFDNGFEITITDINGMTFGKSTSNEISIERNIIKPMKAFVVDMPIDDMPYLTFKADSEQTLTMTKAINSLEFSVNGSSWKELGVNIIKFGGSLGNLRLRGKSSFGTANSTSTSKYATIVFGNETNVECNGDIRTLIDYDNYASVNHSGKFCYLFHNCTQLTSAPELPATDLSRECYKYMFKGCENLRIPPELPATIMADECYGGMFCECTNLQIAPELPATKLAGWCYYYMFYGCKSLTRAPSLNVITLTDYCYHSMFEGCTSLREAPQLPATTLTEYCYAYMFYGCKELTVAPILSAPTLVEGCYWCMFKNCSQLKNITMLANDISPAYCLNSWVSGVSETGLFTKSGLMTTLVSGESGIPNGWKVDNWGID